VTDGAGSAGGTGTASGAVATAVARPAGGAMTFGALAALELMAVVLVPAVLLSRQRRTAVAK